MCAGLAPGAADINSQLLQISDLLLTSFTAQSEDQILGLVRTALRRESREHAQPRQWQSPPSSCAKENCQPHQQQQQQQQHVSPEFGLLKASPPDDGQRWTLSAAHCSDEVSTRSWSA